MHCVVSAFMVCYLNTIAPSVQHYSMIIHYIDVNQCKILTPHRVKQQRDGVAGTRFVPFRNIHIKCVGK